MHQQRAGACRCGGAARVCSGAGGECARAALSSDLWPIGRTSTQPLCCPDDAVLGYSSACICAELGHAAQVMLRSTPLPSPHLCPLRVGGHQVVVAWCQALVARHVDHVTGLLLVQPADHLQLRLEGGSGGPGRAGAQLRGAGSSVRRRKAAGGQEVQDLPTDGVDGRTGSSRCWAAVLGCASARVGWSVAPASCVEACTPRQPQCRASAGQHRHLHCCRRLVQVAGKACADPTPLGPTCCSRRCAAVCCAANEPERWWCGCSSCAASEPGPGPAASPCGASPEGLSAAGSISAAVLAPAAAPGAVPAASAVPGEALASPAASPVPAASSSAAAAAAAGPSCAPGRSSACSSAGSAAASSCAAPTSAARGLPGPLLPASAPSALLLPSSACCARYVSTARSSP